MKMFEPSLALASDDRIVRMIRHYQGIQKTNRPTAGAWQHASGQLAVLFNEMRMRHPNGSPGLVL